MASARPRTRWRQARASPGERWVVIYDGQCAFCSHSVQFIHARDSFSQFWFAPQGGEYARAVAAARPEIAGLDTVVLVDERDGRPERARVLSAAVLEISRRLGGFWWWLHLLRLVPRQLRDFVYRRIAANRRRLLHKRGPACRVPTEAFRARCLA